MLGSRAVRACMSKSSTSAFDFASSCACAARDLACTVHSGVSASYDARSMSRTASSSPRFAAFAYSSLTRRGAPNCIRMNPRSRCASGMLGSSSTVYNDQPTSAEVLPSRACTEIGYEANIQQFDQNPTYKRVCRAHPRAYGENGGMLGKGCMLVGSSPRVRGTPAALPIRWRTSVL